MGSNDSCLRCYGHFNEYSASDQRLWNVVVKTGFVVGYLCPQCQTPEENAEAEHNSATFNYDNSWLDAYGRWWATAKK